ncbi:MAG: FtsW/RodA/SpoVE family cell cycle protein [Planctomycetota bacterium]
MKRRASLRARFFGWLGRSDWEVLPWAALVLAVGFFAQWSVAGPDHLPTAHLARMAAAVAVGILAASLSSRRWRNAAWLFYAGCLILLGMVLVMGPTINNARRWLDLGFFRLQPSEFAKLGLILALARWFSERPRPRRLEEMVVPAALTLVPFLLVLTEPDLGTALTFGPVFLGMAWLAGTRGRVLAALLVIPVFFAPLAVLGLRDYQLERVETWWQQDQLTPEQKTDSGYHLWHAKLAVGSGGLTGYGWGQGPENRLGRLPERHNDFIFPVIAEEFGFLGAAAVLLLYAALAGTALFAAARHRDPFLRLVVAGVGLHFAVHLVLNVGVSLGVWPTTGLPLPLVSWGGSSMVASGLGIGLLLSASAARGAVFLARAFQD